MAALMICCLFSPVPAIADDSASLETRLRAAFLFNFARFTSWPQEADAAGEGEHLTFCIINARALAEALRSATKGKDVAGRPIHVREPDDLSATAPCDVIYLPDTPPQWVAVTQSRPALLVGEGTRFAQTFGMVGFFVQDGRLRFAINDAHVRAAGLQMSSRLLGLATLVGDGGSS